MSKELKCNECKKEYGFYFHECKYAIHEYYGCKTCDNICMKCNKKYAENIIYGKK